MSNKCIIFSRVSTTRQELAEQTAAIRRKAEYLGYSSANQHLIEVKESGIKLGVDERAGLTKLREAIESDPAIDCVIVWELSRIGRRADVIFAVRDYLIEHHVRWVIMKPEIEVLASGGKMTDMTNLLLGMFTAMTENEMNIKKERFARGKEALKDKGLFAGGKVIMGYAVKDKHYVIDPVLGPVIRYIYSEYAENGRSGYSIGKELYEKGSFGVIPLKLCIRKVKHILEHREYIGDKRYPALVSKELWDKAESIRNSRTRGARRAPSHWYYCQGIVFDNTGHSLTPEWSDAIYRSRNTTSSISVNILDSLCFDLAHKHILRFGSASKNEAMQNMKKAMAVINRKKNVANRRYNELMAQVEKIEKRFILGKITESMADELEKEAQAEASTQLLLVKKYELELQSCIDKINKYKEDINSISFSEIMDDKAKYEIVHTAISKIIVERMSKYFTSVEITFDDLHTEKYTVNARTHKVTDSSNNNIEYEYIARAKRSRK